jgi:hypothetical protein
MATRKLYKNQDGNIEIINEDFCRVISLEGFESHGPNFATDEDDVDKHDGDYLLCYEDGSFQICVGDWQYGVQTTAIQPDHQFFATEKDGEDCDASDIASGLQPLCDGYIFWDGHNWVLMGLSEQTGMEELPEFDYETVSMPEPEKNGETRQAVVGNDGADYWYVETRWQGKHNYLTPRENETCMVITVEHDPDDTEAEYFIVAGTFPSPAESAQDLSSAVIEKPRETNATSMGLWKNGEKISSVAIPKNVKTIYCLNRFSEYCELDSE